MNKVGMQSAAEHPEMAAYAGNRWELSLETLDADAVMLAFQARLLDTGWPEEESHELAIGFKEALANAMRYGKTKTIIVELDVEADRCTVGVEDEGEPFVPADIPDPTVGEGLLKGSGLGCLFMRQFFGEDGVVVELYAADGRGGNRVTLSKTRNHDGS